MIFVFFIKNRAAAVLAIVKLMFIKGINVYKVLMYIGQALSGGVAWMQTSNMMMEELVLRCPCLHW